MHAGILVLRSTFLRNSRASSSARGRQSNKQYENESEHRVEHRERSWNLCGARKRERGNGRRNELTAFRGPLIFGLEPTRSRCFYNKLFTLRRGNAIWRMEVGGRGGGRTEEGPNGVKESRGMKRAGGRKGHNIISITKRRDVRRIQISSPLVCLCLRIPSSTLLTLVMG